MRDLTSYVFDGIKTDSSAIFLEQIVMCLSWNKSQYPFVKILLISKDYERNKSRRVKVQETILLYR